MPKVGGKHFAYTKEGYRKADALRKRLKRGATPKKTTKTKRSGKKKA